MVVQVERLLRDESVRKGALAGQSAARVCVEGGGATKGGGAEFQVYVCYAISYSANNVL